jgi:hypothetical protein
MKLGKSRAPHVKQRGLAANGRRQRSYDVRNRQPNSLPRGRQQLGCRDRAIHPGPLALLCTGDARMHLKACQAVSSKLEPLGH